MEAKSIISEDLLESSSSSDEEDMYPLLLERKYLPRVKNFVENVIYQYSPNDFKKNLRLTRESAQYLIERYSNWYLVRTYQGGRKQTSVETQILSFLWFSGNKTTFREVANVFDISLSNLHNSFQQVLKFLLDEIAPEAIKFPQTTMEKEVISNDFQQISGFPNVLGGIDGSYISVRTPKHKIRSTYANRHDRVSITLQGICDSKLRFLDVYTEVPSKELQNLCAPNYHLLGDSAYPLREYLLTPFRDYGNLSDSEKNYNLKFCQSRVKIENAFGVLKSRFRQLMRLDFHNVETMAQFVIATCVLHNICIEKNHLFNKELSINEIHINSEHNDDDRRDRLLRRWDKRKEMKLKPFCIIQQDK
ncbi:putative nuclease HARBI1 [Lucilia cuprina]|uniref:putative nuclease HARBI1 n=1 Tax=Lucilia cuprina TaxID=7375 RepID=UPI001F057CFC|nr:putative nuclease HARBI1 [Lucilia cuprina]